MIDFFKQYCKFICSIWIMIELNYFTSFVCYIKLHLGLAWAKSFEMAKLLTLKITNISCKILTATSIYCNCFLLWDKSTQNGNFATCNTNLYVLYRKYYSADLPVQLTPSPSHPSLHVHVKLPSASAHVASSWQLSVSLSHSSMSREIYG